MDLKAILADTAKYADDQKITLADGVETTLGDLRQFNAARSTELDERAQQLTRQQDNLSRLANEIAAAQSALESAPANPANADPRLVQLMDLLTGKGNKPSIFDDTPEYFRPLTTRLEQQAADVKAAQDALARQQKDVRDTIAWYTKHQVNRDFRHYNDWPEKFTVSEAVQYAQTNKLLDEVGYPDFDRVHDAVTAPTRQAKQLEDERKRIRTEEREKLRAENAHVLQPRGGIGAPALQAKDPKAKKYGGPAKVPDDVILNDPDIWTNLVTQ